MAATTEEPALFPRFLEEVQALKENLKRLADEKEEMKQELASTRKAARVWESRVRDFERAELGEAVLGVDGEAWLQKHRATLKWHIGGRGREVFVIVNKRIVARAPKVKEAVAKAKAVFRVQGRH